MSSTIEKIQQPEFIQSKTQVNKRVRNFAASWYVAMHSKDLGKEPKAIQLFGQPLVAWRDHKGHPIIMEPYCSHMGAYLAIGKVVDGCIQCPFHHWRYESSGHCVSIPEIDHIPPMARQVTYVTVERYGYIWVWYGSQTPLFSLPEFSAMEDERHNYMPAYLVTETNTTVPRVIENALDYHHISSVHNRKLFGSLEITLLNEQHSVEMGEPPIQKEAWLGTLLEFPSSRREDIVGTIARAFGLTGEVSSVKIDVWPTGVISTFLIGNEVFFRELGSVIPVAENKVTLTRLIAVKKTRKFWVDTPNSALIRWKLQATVAQDIPIWSTLKPDAGKVHVKYDWLVLKYRNFYQSWVDKVIT